MSDHDAEESAPGQAPSEESTAEASPTVPELLLALQEVDTEADQLAHRRAKSPVREEFATRSAQVAEWEKQRASLDRGIEEFGGSVENADKRSAQLLADRHRLEAQLKTVIAPREAEALMHEIATIESKRDTFDMEGLEALERQSSLDDDRSRHLQSEEGIRAALRLADDTLGKEVGEIDATLERLDVRRGELRELLSDALLRTYDRKRGALGVAVARLVGKTCRGCHLELSAAEIDTVREDAASSGVTDCPDCGRLLIV